MADKFYEGVDRSGTACIKWDFQKEDYGTEGLLPFSIADSDYPTCQAVIDALQRRIRHGVFGYTEPDSRFLSAVALWCETRHNWKIRPEWITTAAGIIPAVSAAIASLTSPQAKILVQPPVYDPFYSVIRANNRTVCENHLLRSENGEYTIDFPDLERQLRGGAEMLLFCSPHNPVGRVWSEEDVRHVVSLCRKYKVVLVSDEIHWDILPGGISHFSSGAAAANNDTTVICTAPSKTFNLAGLQTSNIIIQNPDLRGRFQNWLFSRYMFCANALGLEACRAAYELGADWADAQNIYLHQNAEIAAGFFKKNIPCARVADLQGTYLMWIDLTYLRCSSDKLIGAIAAEGAGLNSGKHYGDRYDGFVRMNIACSRANLLSGLDCIAKAVHSL